MKTILRFGTVVLIALFLAACSSGGGPAPEADNGSREAAFAVEISASSETVLFGEAIDLKASTDYEGEGTPAYEWSAAAGEFSEETAQETKWVAPSDAGSIDITVTVTIGSESETASLTISVESDEAMPFNLRGISPRFGYVGIGEDLDLTVDAGGYLADEVTYELTYSCFGGDGNDGSLDKDEGQAVIFSAPIVESEGHSVRLKAFHNGEQIGDEHAALIEVGFCSSGDFTDLDNSCVISNVYQLQDIGRTIETMEGHYRLDGDIDASATQTLDGGKGFLPIGTKVATDTGDSNNVIFRGTFDGQGHTIRDLTIDRPTSNIAGLFVYMVLGAEVHSFTLENLEVNGAHMVGGVAGSVIGGVIRDVHINNGIITGNDSLPGVPQATGAITGGGQQLRLENFSLTNVEVSGHSSHIGGVAGILSGGSHVIDSVLENVSVSGVLGQVGGITGELRIGSTIDNIHANRLKITSENGEDIGGPVGENNGEIINSVVSESRVEGDNIAIGGIVGRNSGTGKIHSTAIIDSSVIGGPNFGASVGGIAGASASELLRVSVIDTDVQAPTRVGGIVGIQFSEGASIRESFVYGTSSSVETQGDYAGGVVGELLGGVIRNSYVILNTVSGGGDYIGGLVGHVAFDGDVNTSYGHTQVRGVVGSSHVGGLIGDAVPGSTVLRSFWLEQDQGGPTTSAGGQKLTPSEMEDELNFAGQFWAFEIVGGDAIWQMPADGSDGPLSPDLIHNSRF